MFTLNEVNEKVPDGFNVVVYSVLFGGSVFKSLAEKTNDYYKKKNKKKTNVLTVID